MTTKKSIGIALCRRNPANKIPEVLIICSKKTYGFSSFVFGKYSLGDTERIQILVSNMTSYEKLLISQLDFNKLWYHIWLRIPEADDSDTKYYSFYLRCRNKFGKLIQRDGGKRIKILLTKTPNIQLKWEIPKGRSEDQETEIKCAIREFYEETGISSDVYHILWDVKPICVSYIDNDVTYIVKHYVAWTETIFTPKLDYGNQRQLAEVTGIEWADLKKINQLDNTNKYLKYQAKIALKCFTNRAPVGN